MLFTPDLSLIQCSCLCARPWTCLTRIVTGILHRQAAAARRRSPDGARAAAGAGGPRVRPIRGEQRGRRGTRPSQEKRPAGVPAGVCRRQTIFLLKSISSVVTWTLDDATLLVTDEAPQTAVLALHDARLGCRCLDASHTSRMAIQC